MRKKIRYGLLIDNLLIFVVIWISEYNFYQKMSFNERAGFFPQRANKYWQIFLQAHLKGMQTNALDLPSINMLINLCTVLMSVI
jgi:hypothetical protein